MPKQRPMGEDEDEDLMLEDGDDAVEPDEDEGEGEAEPAPEPDEPEEEEPEEEEIEPRRPPKRDARDRAAKARERAIKHRQQLREARQAAEKATREADELRRRLADVELSTADDAISRIDRDIERMESDLASAFENGDSKVQAKISREIARLEVKRDSVERLQAERKASAPQAAPQQTQPQGVDLTSLPDHILEWVARTDFMAWSEAEKAIATAIGNKLLVDGYDENDPEYIQELNRRVKVRIPWRMNSAARQNGEPRDLRRRQPSPSPAMEERAQRPQVGPKRVLNQSERRLIRQIHGLAADQQPSKAQVDAYLRANPTPMNIR